MNLEAIPKTFWHTISICLLIVTTGLVTIAYKAENFSIKYNEIELLSSGNQAMKTQLDQQAENIVRQAQIMNERQAEIEQLKRLSEDRLKELNEAHNLIADLNSKISKVSPNSRSSRSAANQKIKSVNSLAAPQAIAGAAEEDISQQIEIIAETIRKERNKDTEINNSIAAIKQWDVLLEQQQKLQYEQQQQIEQQQEIQQQLQQQILRKY